MQGFGNEGKRAAAFCFQHVPIQRVRRQFQGTGFLFFEWLHECETETLDLPQALASCSGNGLVQICLFHEGCSFRKVIRK